MFEVSPLDPLTYIVVLGGVAAVACYLPARRATLIEPMLALKAE